MRTVRWLVAACLLASATGCVEMNGYPGTSYCGYPSGYGGYPAYAYNYGNYGGAVDIQQGVLLNQNNTGLGNPDAANTVTVGSTGGRVPLLARAHPGLPRAVRRRRARRHA